GWLNGWRLTFGGERLGWEGALATLVEDPLCQVFVALYDIAPMDEDSLDRWEGAGLDIYRRTRVRAHT
ncbi:gamma-glutamylcyclotransferase, partial [Streptomyces sp. TRM76130]|nr:gamma-glutamylcyclotransferase [Streptomyces sp. TRM76130]